MKIAYLANNRFPSERAHAAQIAHMCKAFVENDCEVDLYVSKRPTEGKSLEDQFGFSPQFSIFRLCPSRIFPKLKFTFYTGELVFALHFLLLCKTRQYKIIYSRSEWLLYFLSFLLSLKRLVWESHEAKYSLAAKRLLKKGVRTVAISVGIKEFYCGQGVNKKQILVADDGIDESFFDLSVDKKGARATLALPENSFIAMYIGGFDPWKGVDTFFAAAEKVPEILFVAIGGSPEQVKEFSQKYPKVLFLGSKPYRELRDHQQAADILVVPNTAKIALSSTYTSPLKLFAHMTSGVPLAVSDIPSLTTITGKELVTAFTADDSVALASALMQIKDNHEERKLAAAELKQLARQYTWHNRAQSIIQFVGG